MPHLQSPTPSNQLLQSRLCRLNTLQVGIPVKGDLSVSIGNVGTFKVSPQSIKYQDTPHDTQDSRSMVRENLRYDYVYNWTTGPPCLEQAKKSNVAGPRSLAESVQTQTECVILVYFQNARIIDTVKRMLLNLQ